MLVPLAYCGTPPYNPKQIFPYNTMSHQTTLERVTIKSYAEADVLVVEIASHVDASPDGAIYQNPV